MNAHNLKFWWDVGTLLGNIINQFRGPAHPPQPRYGPAQQYQPAPLSFNYSIHAVQPGTEADFAYAHPDAADAADCIRYLRDHGYPDLAMQLARKATDFSRRNPGCHIVITDVVRTA